MKTKIANVLRRIANRLSPPPAGKVHPKLSVTRSRGAVIAAAHWAVQAILSGKTPHPGIHKDTTVFFPEWDLEAHTGTDERKTFRLTAEVTTMAYSRFWRMEAHIEVCQIAGDTAQRGVNRRWTLDKASFALARDGRVERLEFDAAASKFRELTHVETHLRHYFERMLEGDTRSCA